VSPGHDECQLIIGFPFAGARSPSRLRRLAIFRAINRRNDSVVNQGSCALERARDRERENKNEKESESETEREREGGGEERERRKRGDREKV